MLQRRKSINVNHNCWKTARFIFSYVKIRNTFSHNVLRNGSFPNEKTYHILTALDLNFLHFTLMFGDYVARAIIMLSFYLPWVLVISIFYILNCGVL